MMRINLWGAPGSGKTTHAARLFSDFKIKGHSVELVSEYIKKWAYQKRVPKSFDQVYIFGHQIHAEDLVQQNGVEILVTDSPLMLQCFYGEVYNTPFYKHLIEIAQLYEANHPSVNIFLDNRDIPYQQNGRYETEAESNTRRHQMMGFLDKHKIEHAVFSTLDYSGLWTYLDAMMLTPSAKPISKKRYEEGPLYGVK